MRPKTFINSKRFRDYIMQYYRPKRYLKTEIFDKMIHAPHLKDTSLPKYSEWIEKITQESFKNELKKITRG